MSTGYHRFNPYPRKNAYKYNHSSAVNPSITSRTDSATLIAPDLSEYLKTQNMVETSPQDGPASSKRLRIGLLVSVSSMMALVAKRARLVSKKLKAATNTHSNHDCLNHHAKFNHSPSMQPRSPLARPKQLLTQISNKATTLMHNNKKRHVRDESDDDLRAEDFGDGGVWQRAILMGDRCEPLDFSGVIYYDNTGKQLKDAPIRSPRASPLPGYLARAN